MTSLGMNEDALFVPPSKLTIDHQLVNAYESPEPREAQAQGAAHPDHHNKQLPGDEQRPDLSLPTFFDWNIRPQASIRLSLPLPPLSPFSPSRPLTEDEKLAFPCLGGPQDCWNLELCPKHRQFPATPPELNYCQSTEQQTTAHDPRGQSLPARTTPSGPDQETRSALKRHATDPNDTPTESSLSRPPLPKTSLNNPRSDSRPPPPRGRVPHNLVERRYRDNLNHQIEVLRLTLPSLRDAQPADYYCEDPSSSPRMPSKAVVIQTAASYIQDLQSERKRLLDSNRALQEQMASLQRLVRCEEASGLQYINAMRLTAGL